MKDNKDAAKYNVLTEVDSKGNQTLASTKGESFNIEISQTIQKLKEALQSNNSKIERLQEENEALKENFVKYKAENIETFNVFTKNLSKKVEKLNKELSIEIKQEIKEEEKTEMIKLYKEGVDGDSYLYLSVVLSYNALTLMIRFLCQGLCKKEVSWKTKIWGFFSILLAPLLLVPGLLTPIIQILSFLFVLEAAEEDFTLSDKNNLMLIKLLILFVFVLMVTKEASQAINGMFYCYFEASVKSTFFLSGCFLPQIIQIIMTFFLLYVSILLIFSSDDSVDLIQNFAALYILLEIDNIVMEFVRLTKLNSILLKIDYGLHGVREALKSQEIYNHQVIKKILVENEIEVDFASHSKWSKYLFIIVRTITLGSLIAFGVMVWYLRVESSPSS